MTDVICDVRDSCVSMRSEIVSSLSRVLTADPTETGRFCSGVNSSGSIIVGGDRVERETRFGGVATVLGGVDVLGLFGGVVRFS